MVMRKNAPENLRGAAGAEVDSKVNSTTFYKGNTFFLSKLQSKVFSLLSQGKFSSHKLMQLCHTSDPRKEVQYLRRKGINVQDEWVEATETIPRHKLYFINPNDCQSVLYFDCELSDKQVQLRYTDQISNRVNND